MDLDIGRTVVAGLAFAEGPRWHEGALWFSDMHGGAVHRVDADGVDTVVVEPDDAPSGLGWLPDGSMLVVAMETQRLLRVSPGGLVTGHADVSHLARGSLNDMVVARDGTAYVGDMGARIFSDHPDYSVPGQIIAVDAQGEAAVVADGLKAPNGMVLPPGETELIVAESGGFRVLTFDRTSTGGLGDAGLFADLVPVDTDVRGAAPDGICGDLEGAVWAADPLGARVIRVWRGGQVTHSVRFTEDRPFACVLGGTDRRTLFVCAAKDHEHTEGVATRSGRVVEVRVGVPGVGTP